ncbi:unnamed protein product [Thlaspi arvense]|uniref:Leucine-rich repeat-containing N-terminal plant-type domain-containing protein n=1 Tax=Thlaspi arvense TaxID=13288 RepID=A0AAU9T7T2_THLAR|nr:unnamed protein product [Thlaspi arvense]
MIIWSLCLIFSLSNSILVSASPAKHLCRPDQRDALWDFKNEFYVEEFQNHPTPVDKKTKSWRNNTDCCSWDGTSCDPKTGKVIELDLVVGDVREAGVVCGGGRVPNRSTQPKETPEGVQLKSQWKKASMKELRLHYGWQS